MAWCWACLILFLATPRTLAQDASSPAALVGESVNDIKQIDVPDLAPAKAPTQELQADCLTEADVFYGSDFLSTTTSTTATSAVECCAACKNAADCTVWNWCGKAEGCILPSNLWAAANRTSYPFQSCVWKPRPIDVGGTLPEPPVSNRTMSMVGWTSGIPINATVLPPITGFQLTTGIEMEYSEDQDFYCTGSSTSKPVCQLYGNAKGGAAACLNNPICRGFQLCWNFPLPSSGSGNFFQLGTIRMKAGAQVPLNISGAIENPYCSVYVASGAAAPADASQGYAVNSSDATISNAVAKFERGNGRRLAQDGGSPLRGGTGATAIIGIAPQQQAPVAAPSPLASLPPLQTSGTNFTTPFLQGVNLPAFLNITFNYSQCYASAPTLKLTLQSQAYPLQGPNNFYSIHTWIEAPFQNSGEVCCAFEDVDDIFLNLETGGVAVALPTFVGTDPILLQTPLKNYDTKPISIVEPLVYNPIGQLNSPLGRPFTFPKNNGSAYVDAVESVYFAVSQVALGSIFCTPGSPELGPVVDYLGDLLRSLSEDSVETPGGVPLNMEFTTAPAAPDGSIPAACLTEQGATYEGGSLKVFRGESISLGECCSQCWSYLSPEGQECDVFVWNAGVCELRNSTLAADNQPVPAVRGTNADIYSGRRTAVLPLNSTSLFGVSVLK